MPDQLSASPILLVGAGPMAQAYGQVLKVLGQPFSVIGRGQASALAFEEAVGVSVGLGGIAEQLARLPELPAKIIVAVSAVGLAEATLELIRAGARDLLVEKPAGMTPEEVHGVASAASEVGARVFVAYNRRFYAATRAARAMIAEDGGPLSVKFDFTEATRRIEALPKDPRELAGWFYGNSTHVVDTAFHLAGEPEWLQADSSGGLSWHPAGAIFAGHGRTTAGALASWHADWLAPGRWGVEVMTAKRRLVLQPMEELFVQVHGSFALTRVEIDDAIDKSFKPGIHAQTTAWLDGGSDPAFIDIQEHAARFRYLETMLAGGSYRRAVPSDRTQSSAPKLPPVIIEGVGSAGQRHARALEALGTQARLVSRRPGIGHFISVRDAVAETPDAILVVASETARHQSAIAEAAAAGHRGPIVIEKPIAGSREQFDAMPLRDRSVFVTYNLRHHPLIRRLADTLSGTGSLALSVTMHAGQDLDQWRPGTPALESYSASKAKGGGVLRDLSHEIDLIDHLFGPIKRVSALGGRLTDKTVDSDDCWTILLETENGAAIALTLNYLDRPARREIHVTTAKGSLSVDLAAGSFTADGATETVSLARDETTIAMWRDLAGHLASGAPTVLCDAAAAARTLDVIQAIEDSAARGEWAVVGPRGSLKDNSNPENRP